MDGHFGFTLRAVLLLLLVSNCVSADKVQFGLGKDVTFTLEPPHPGLITNIVWKFKGDLLAEWVKNIVDLTYYSSFKGRATLDRTTARLEIRNMGRSDVGLYTVEINGVTQDQSFVTEVIKDVPKPKIWVQPLTCSSLSTNCTLICDGDTTEAGSVTYSWKKGDGDWMKGEKALEIINTETKDVKTFTCRIKNKISQEESDALPNPFLKVPPPPPPPPTPVWKTVVIVICCLLVVVGLGVGCWQRERIWNFFATLFQRESPENDNGGPEVNVHLVSPGNNSGNGPNPAVTDHPMSSENNSGNGPNPAVTDHPMSSENNSGKDPILQ